jgi:hypothetical protein
MTDTFNVNKINSNENQNNILSNITSENMDDFLDNNFETLNEQVFANIKITKLISVGSFGKVIF